MEKEKIICFRKAGCIISELSLLRADDEDEEEEGDSEMTSQDAGHAQQEQSSGNNFNRLFSLHT